jgi:hypothetical protein
MKSLESAIRRTAAVAVAALLAACAGPGASPTTGGMSSTLPSSQIFNPDHKCKSQNGVKVTPCHVRLTASQPYQKITVKSPSGSTVTVDDKRCTKRGIATVTGSGSTWSVTAGGKRGACIAIFTAKGNGKQGRASLYIANNPE